MDDIFPMLLKSIVVPTYFLRNPRGEWVQVNQSAYDWFRAVIMDSKHVQHGEVEGWAIAQTTTIGSGSV